MVNVRRCVWLALFGLITSLGWQFAYAGDPAQQGQFSDQRIAFDFEGEERSYILHVPEQAVRASQAGQNVPLVLVLHGGGGNALHAIRITGFSRKAAEEGFVVVYPDGTATRLEQMKTWNAKHCCAQAMRDNTDDAGFLAALIDRLIEQHAIDPQRVFVTGMSNGGMMSHQLAIAYPEKIAGIAPVVGGLFGDEDIAQHGVPALIINGVLDRSIPMVGGLSKGRGVRAWDGTELQPVVYQGEYWARANGCDRKAAEREETQSATILRYSCSPSTPVVHYLVKDNGHAWPGGEKGSRRGDTPTTALNATDLIWEFFAGLTQ